MLWVLVVVLFFCAVSGFSALRIFLNFEVLATTLLLPLLQLSNFVVAEFPQVGSFCCCCNKACGFITILQREAQKQYPLFVCLFLFFLGKL